MTNRTTTGLIAAAVAVPLAALTLAACGSAGSTASASNTPPTADGKPATLGVGSNGGLGKILVDGKGSTLYVFEKDAGTRSACTGACATSWPPLRDSHKPAVGSGASASKVTTAPRPDGASQVVYNGHPLYLFAGDQKPGDTNGQGVTAFGGAWYAVSPPGDVIMSSASTGGGY